MLARLAVKLAFGIEAAAGALQKQVRAFTAGQFRLRSGVTCHCGSLIVTQANPVVRFAVSLLFGAIPGL